MKTFNQLITKRGDHEFSSGCYTGQDFKDFARDFRSVIKAKCKQMGFELAKFNRGHYYLSGFIKNGDKYSYFSISDVRYFTNDWFNNVLVRSATCDTDYTGGANQFTNLNNLMVALECII